MMTMVADERVIVHSMIRGRLRKPPESCNWKHCHFTHVL